MSGAPFGEHLTRTFGIFKDMVGMEDLRIYHHGEDLRIETRPTEGTEITAANLPFGTILRNPKALLNTLHFAIYAMNRAARKNQMVTVVVGKFNGDSDTDPAVNVYKGLLDEQVAINRCAKDLAKEFTEDHYADGEALKADWTFTVFSMSVQS